MLIGLGAAIRSPGITDGGALDGITDTYPLLVRTNHPATILRLCGAAAALMLRPDGRCNIDRREPFSVVVAQRWHDHRN